MINASLLVVLFIGALTRQEEVLLQENPSISKLNGPLFSDEADFALKPASVQSEMISLPATPRSVEVETPILHKLPQVAVSPAPTLPPEPVVASHPVVSPVRIEEFFQEVVVKKGESLDKIAKAHHTSVDEIIKLNQLPGSFLKVGQVLKIPAKKEALASRVVQEKQAANVEYYTVKVGDNPWSIAMKHHMKVEELLKLNGLNEENARKLKPGNRLRIR